MRTSVLATVRAFSSQPYNIRRRLGKSARSRRAWGRGVVFVGFGFGFGLKGGEVGVRRHRWSVVFTYLLMAAYNGSDCWLSSEVEK